MIQNIPEWLAGTAKEIIAITYELFKLMIPIIIIVKITEELGGIRYIAMALGPVMDMAGLPASMGLVWATTMIVNIYGGMIIFVTSTGQESLTVAQVSVLGAMMLIAHSLPIEVRIAQKAGVNFIYTLILRIGGALLLGVILHKIYSTGSFLQQTNEAIWQPQKLADDSLMTWVINQIQILGQVFIIIVILVIFLKLLKLSGIEKLIAFLLRPFLKILGLTRRTTSITIIGITLGLTYGGVLLINEVKKGEISPRDVFGSLSLLALCHSLIEDTILIALIGGDLSGILYARILFSILLVMLIMAVTSYYQSKRKMS